MSPAEMRGSVFDAVLADWSPDPLVYIAAGIASLFYIRGWWILHRRVPERFGQARLVSFMAGQAALLLAIGSPLDAFADLLLQAHMAQHWLLMMVAPPLLWLGAPQVAILRGLPPSWRKEGLGPFLAWPPLQQLGRFLGHPVTAWSFFVVASWAWHAPALYELALSSETWHQVEHVFFLSGALLFWWPVVQPWPSHPVWPRWALIPYLVLAAVQNTILASLFAFSSRLFYPHYATVPRVFDLSPLDDQRAAGALLWVASALVLLPAASILVVRALAPRTLHAPFKARPPVPIARKADALRLRGLGPLLRSGVFRRVLQFGCFGVAVAVILDGWWGPQRMSASNLAGVLPWTYWRGLVVVGLLVAGSLFCMACPFTLSRGLAKRLLGERFEWPRILRNKWPAIGLLILYFALVEGFEVWASPWATAWLLFAYFAAAFAVDGIFSGASFCKYVCPAGQFQFTLASASPLEVRALDANTCQRCRTKDCLRGNETASGC
ncbi:MAG: cytochrome c oxidase assembly protein, partial [Myxococcota bacterium]|nr:cytochrome c oxidase assembly protein [Myxococcota bacterium]